MPLALRQRHDPAPHLDALSELVVHRETDARIMGALQGKPVADMTARFDAGHRAYVAWYKGEPAAWGWVATRSADIGELKASFTIPEGDRYLWNFVTLKSHRGLGIYPRLLDAIVRAECTEALRFWVAWAPENHASGSGIRKAGFTAMAELSFDHAGQPALQALVKNGGLLAAQVLGLPEVQDGLAQCWRCARAGRSAAMACPPGACCCDYQQPLSGCAAEAAIAR